MSERRSRRAARWAAAMLGAAIALRAPIVASQPTPPPAAEPDPSEPPQPSLAPPEMAPASEQDRAAEAKAEARVRFEKGKALFQQGDLEAAVAEFLASRALYLSKSATDNAARCLFQLKRYDEALDLYEALLREFPDLSPEYKRPAQAAVTQLRALVGTLQIDGAEIDAAIAVDGRARGTHPLLAPLRVKAGSHVVRVYKEGFEAFEQRVDVAGGQTVRVDARLRALVQSGRLRVVERKGRTLEVVIDGDVVGKTPWEGALSLGAHVVLLRGKGRTGTQPAAVTIENRKTFALSLEAERLEALLRVEVVPAGAAILVDSVEVARGFWYERLKTGPHRIEAATEGFLSVRREVNLWPNQREVVTIALERDLDAPLWRKPSRIVLEAGGAFGLVPTLGGEVAGGCADSERCSSGLGTGALAAAHAGYEFGSGLGFGLTAGYLFVEQGLTGRDVKVTPNGLSPTTGVADERLRLTGPLIAGAGGLRFGETVRALVRLNAGLLFGTVGNERTARFMLSDGGTHTAHLVDAHRVTYLVLAPEARVGLPLTDRIEVGAGVAIAMLFALSTPRWDQEGRLVVLPGEGLSTYHDESLAGGFALLIAPGLSIGARF